MKTKIILTMALVAIGGAVFAQQAKVKTAYNLAGTVIAANDTNSPVIVAAFTNQTRTQFDITNDGAYDFRLCEGTNCPAGYGILLKANGGSYSLEASRTWNGAYSARSVSNSAGSFCGFQGTP